MSTQGPIDDDLACLSLRWSQALLAGLLDVGVRHLVLSPGSRSTPLVLAAQSLARSPSGLVLAPVSAMIRRPEGIAPEANPVRPASAP